MRASVVIFAAAIAASSAQAFVMTDVVTVPTYEVPPRGDGEVSLLLYEGGGINTRLILCPFRSFTIGGSFSVDRLVGSGDVSVRDPQICLRWNILAPERFVLPLTIGYDGQFYQVDSARVQHGLYLVSSVRFVPDTMTMDFGVSTGRLSSGGNFHAFLGARFRIGDVLSLNMEAVGNAEVLQVNAGCTVVLAYHLTLDLILNSVLPDRDPVDRQLRINFFSRLF